MLDELTWRRFGDLEPRLEALGYRPVPISPGQKGPRIKGWQAGRPDGGWPERSWVGHKDDGHWVTEWQGPTAACGVGVLTRNVPAIDIDILDHDLAELFLGFAQRAFGRGPQRVGRAPKILLPFQLEGPPFSKLKIGWPVNGSDQGIEILADGQQFVASAIHPGTGQPYRWDVPLWEVPRHELPKLARQSAVQFLRVCARELIARGYAVKAGRGFSIEPERYARLARPRRRYLVPGETVQAWWEMYSAQEVAEAVSPGEASKTGSFWRARCPAHNGVSATSLALWETEGRVVFKCFNDCDSRELTREIWRCLNDR